MASNEQLISPCVSGAEFDNRKLREVSSGIVAVLVEEPSGQHSQQQQPDEEMVQFHEHTDTAQSPARAGGDTYATEVLPTADEDKIPLEGALRVERRSVTQGMASSISPSEVSAVHLQSAGGGRSVAGVPMRHRHQLPPSALELGRELAVGGLPLVAVPASQIAVASSSVTLTDVLAEVHDLLTTTAVGHIRVVANAAMGEHDMASAENNGSFHLPTRPSLTTPIGGSAAVGLLPTVTDTSGVLRSDIDDAIIMQRLVERQQRLQELHALHTANSRQQRGGSDSDDAELEDPSNSEQPPLHVPASGARRNLQDDVFLESLNLVPLDETLDWENPQTFARTHLTMRFLKKKVERDFLRYEMQHHRFQPLIIYSVVVLVVLIAITVMESIVLRQQQLTAVWGAMLGAAAVLVLFLAVVLWRTSVAEPAKPASSAHRSSIDAVVGEGEASSAAERIVRLRSRQLWAARLAELAATLLTLISLVGILSSYSYVTALCYRTSIFYVPWVTDNCNSTIAATGAAAGVITVNDGTQVCPEITRYCSQALFPFLVPAVMTPVILFRPRVFIAVPLMMSTPLLFAASRFMTSENAEVDAVASTFILKMVLVFVIATFGAVVKIALEREQRRRFNAYAILYCRLSQYVRSREALAEFLDARIPPLLRTRLLSGNLSLDFSASATCVIFDISEFASWCTKMLPLTAATSVMQLHDVLSARCAMMGVEKIRSIGDIFVGAANLSVACPQHAAMCCQLAIQVFSDVHEFRHAFSYPVALRCGMHSGKLLGLVLGSTYRRFDVIGDAMGIALRVVDVTHANQVVLTKPTCDLADEYVVVVDRSLTLGGSSSDSGSAAGSHRGSLTAVSEITSPFDSTVVIPLRLLVHLKKVVPMSSGYQAMIKDNGNAKETLERNKQKWAANVNREADDLAQSSPSVHPQSTPSMTPPTATLPPNSKQRRVSYTHSDVVSTDRGTFDIVRPHAAPHPNIQSAASPGTTHETPQEVSLVPALERGALPNVGAIRDFILANNTSTALLEKAISETRMTRVWILQKHFDNDVHEVEFSLTYLRAADRIPMVTAQFAFVGVYLCLIALLLVQSAFFPVVSRSPDPNVRFDTSTIVGAALLGGAAVTASCVGLAVYFSPNFLTESQMIMWLLACGTQALSMFGVATSAPGVVGSDASYLFFLALIALQFGSWSLMGFAILSLVNMGVFLASVNTTPGTFLPIWTLVMLAVTSVLNLYFDRNRERRLREMYRDLFLAKAASKAVQAESTVRRSVMRATLPRPLFDMCMEASNVGKMMTTSVTDGIVAQIRLDRIQDDVVVALSGECANRLREIQERQLGLVHPFTTRSLIEREERESGSLATENSGEQRSRQILHAISAVHRSTEILETLMDSLTGTELCIVQAIGDWITIAGPLEEQDTRGGRAQHSSESHHQHEAPRKSRLAFERRLQQAAYDTMLLFSSLFEMNRPSVEAKHRFPFSAAVACDTIINVLANGEYPSYDLLGAGAYVSRAMMQQLTPTAVVATERFIQQYWNELKLAAEEAGVPPAATTPTLFAAATAAGELRELEASRGSRDAVIVLPNDNSTDLPQPRIGERERWRIRGLGTLWVHNIFPGTPKSLQTSTQTL